MNEENKDVQPKVVKQEQEPLQLRIGNEPFIMVKLMEAMNKNMQTMVRQLAEIKVLLSEKK